MVDDLVKKRALRAFPGHKAGPGSVDVSDMSQPRAVRIFPGLVLLAALLPYVTSLTVPFHYDDEHSVSGNPHIQSLDNLGRFFVDPTCFSLYPDHAMYRPILLVTYAVDHALGGGRAWMFHLTNMVLHVLASLVVLGLLAELARAREVRGDPSFGSLPVVGGLLFALHPVHSEPVFYVSGRSDILVTLFVTLSVFSWMRARRGERGAACAWFGVALLAFALSLLTKASAIVVPALLLAVELLVGPAVSSPAPGKSGPRRWRGLALLLPFVLLSLLYLELRSRLMGSTGIALSRSRLLEQSDVLTGAGRGVLANLLTQTKGFLVYVKLILWPEALSIEHHVEVATSFLDPTFLLSLASVLALSAAIVLWSWRKPLRLFFFLWILIGLAPTSSIIPLNLLLTERRLYLSGPGTAGLLACILLGVAQSVLAPRSSSRRMGLVAPAVLLLVCGLFVGRIGTRGADWKDPLRLWRAAARVAPESDRAHRNLGIQLAQAGEMDEAERELRRAVELHPVFEISRINLGEVLRRLGERDKRVDRVVEAEDQLSWVLARGPTSQMVLHRLAAAKRTRHELTQDTRPVMEAMDLYEILVDLYPEDRVAARGLAVCRIILAGGVPVQPGE